MGCSLVWCYKIQKNIDRDLEQILKKKFTTPYNLDSNDIPFLQGLEAAGVSSANILIEAIRKYGEITLELRC
jgi:hypothetical protein